MLATCMYYTGVRADIHPGTEDVLVVLIHVEQRVAVLAFGQMQLCTCRLHHSSPWVLPPAPSLLVILLPQASLWKSSIQPNQLANPRGTCTCTHHKHMKADTITSQPGVAIALGLLPPSAPENQVLQ